MKTRRTFIKTGVIAGLTAGIPFSMTRGTEAVAKKKELKHWVWIRPNKKDTEKNLREKYERYHNAGIRGVFFEADSEKHFRIAKQQKLEAHRWMWTLNRGEKELLENHPEWYAVSRVGESCSGNPPYVSYYRWLCPSREEVHAYLKADVQRILAKDYVDGIHLDYVRFCDVVLPVNLWDKYDIEQTRELPEYDFCYCNVCRDKFRVWRGAHIGELEYPEASLSWRLFRYNAVNNIVNGLTAVARSNKKPITAAVFPTPEVARRLVRQDWTNWSLDGVCPMIYHGFYKENVAWIGDAVAEGVHGLNGSFPLYAGLFLPDFNNMAALSDGITHALSNGAQGISLFGDVTDQVLLALEQASETFLKE